MAYNLPLNISYINDWLNLTYTNDKFNLPYVYDKFTFHKLLILIIFPSISYLLFTLDSF